MEGFEHAVASGRAFECTTFKFTAAQAQEHTPTLSAARPAQRMQQPKQRMQPEAEEAKPAEESRQQANAAERQRKANAAQRKAKADHIHDLRNIINNQPHSVQHGMSAGQPGVIYVCDKFTKPEVSERMVLGDNGRNLATGVAPGWNVFIYNTSQKVLFGGCVVEEVCLS